MEKNLGKTLLSFFFIKTFCFCPQIKIWKKGETWYLILQVTLAVLTKLLTQRFYSKRIRRTEKVDISFLPLCWVTCSAMESKWDCFTLKWVACFCSLEWSITKNLAHIKLVIPALCMKEALLTTPTAGTQPHHRDNDEEGSVPTIKNQSR